MCMRKSEKEEENAAYYSVDDLKTDVEIIRRMDGDTIHVLIAENSRDDRLDGLRHACEAVGIDWRGEISCADQITAVIYDGEIPSTFDGKEGFGEKMIPYKNEYDTIDAVINAYYCNKPIS